MIDDIGAVAQQTDSSEGVVVIENSTIIGVPYLDTYIQSMFAVQSMKWRDIGKKAEKGEASREDSMIGQLYWYLLQVTRRSEKVVTPILGIYFENFNVRMDSNFVNIFAICV